MAPTMYILDEHNTPVPCYEAVQWGIWMEAARNEQRLHVGSTEVDGMVVSTVFLGLDHNFMGGEPLLFETMIFNKYGSAVDGQSRYHTWQEADMGHKAVVLKLKGTVASESEEVAKRYRVVRMGGVKTTKPKGGK